MHGEGRFGDAVMFVLILSGLLLAMASVASSLTGAAGPQRAMEPESWAESRCAGDRGPSGEETAEFDACRRDALAMPWWRLDIGTLSAAATCLTGAIVVAVWRGASARRPPARDRATSRDSSTSDSPSRN